jgi:HEAT repeat protein
MTPLTPDAALAILDDHGRREHERTEAIRLLAKTPTAPIIERLVLALEDNDPGVRWAAARALSHIGDRTLAPLVRALVTRPNSFILRDSAHHVLKGMFAPKRADLVERLLDAVSGPGAGSATEAVGYEILRELGQP